MLFCKAPFAKVSIVKGLFKDPVAASIVSEPAPVNEPETTLVTSTESPP